LFVFGRIFACPQKPGYRCNSSAPAGLPVFPLYPLRDKSSRRLYIKLKWNRIAPVNFPDIEKCGLALAKPERARPKPKVWAGTKVKGRRLYIKLKWNRIAPVNFPDIEKCGQALAKPAAGKRSLFI
jgi:hypothetical protein